MKSNNFSKNKRLLSAGDFTLVFQENDFRVSNQHLLILAKSTQAQYSRLGLVIAKKNIPKAVSRNRIKRLIRETFRLCDNEFDTIDIVVLVKKGLDKYDNQTIRSQIDTLLTKLITKKQNHASC